MKLHRLALALSLAFIAATPARSAPKSATLDDLKKLPITCLVPAWLPEGYHLESVEIDRTDREGLEDRKAPAFPGYSLEYSNGKKGKFTIESARLGIGDRNLDDDPQAEESEFGTKTLGKVYIIYVPKGKTGAKKRIAANWIADAAWRSEEKSAKGAPHIKGRVHGVSGYAMTLAEFEKIVQSLHPILEK